MNYSNQDHHCLTLARDHHQQLSMIILPIQRQPCHAQVRAAWCRGVNLNLVCACAVGPAAHIAEEWRALPKVMLQ